MRVRSVAWLAILAVLGAAVDAAVAEETRLSDLLRDPSSFDGRSLVLHGTLTRLQTYTSRKGHRSYTFRLSEGSREVLVLMNGRPTCERETAVTVRGRFEASTKHIDATEVACD